MGIHCYRGGKKENITGENRRERWGHAWRRGKERSGGVCEGEDTLVLRFVKQTLL